MEYEYVKAVDVDPELCTLIAMEECAELIQAISKAKRGKLDKDNLTEEIADVLICIEWLYKKYDINYEDVLKWRSIKSNRIVDRISKGEFK